MKPLNYSFFAIVIMSLLSCSNQSKVEEKIADKIKSKLGNPGSYESIEFSELKPDSLPLDDYHDRTVELYKVFLGQRKLNLESSALVDMSDVYDDWPKQIEDYKKEVELYTYKFDSVTKVKQDFEKDWFENKRYAVYSLKHKYRAENKLGGMEIYNKQFYLTQNLDSIINCFWCKY